MTGGRAVKIGFYTPGEEIFSAVTHGAGAVFAVAGTAVMTLLSALYGDALCVAGSLLYGLSLIVLYACSTLYHALTCKTAKKVFRVLDHCTIFLLIAGTYTPVALIHLRDDGGVWLLGVLWGFTVLGMILNAVSVERFKAFSMVCYLCMGWCAVFKARALLSNMALPGVVLIAAGGIFYTAGLLFFGSRHKYMHSVWHLFVLGGSAAHYAAVLLYTIRPQLSFS